MKNIRKSDDMAFLLFVIPELDAVVLKDYYDELEKKSKKPPKGRKK